MKEFIIFFLIFLIVFSFVLIVVNGRYIYIQLKYHFIGPPPVFSESVSYEIEAKNWERLVIPSIGIEAPIVLPESITEYSIQKALEKGVVQYPDSNIILGHSSAYPWYKGNYGSVFSLLNKLEKGNEIFIFSNKEKYTYQVLEKQINLPKNLNLEDTKESSIIYLVSCWPISTVWKRITVKAKILDKK